ncbi:histidine kinase dimerization/phospho-acceptor domain-containing protein [Niallia sp. Krafla_26]|uniref:histidine kinase dimerization/phospho-acceptor domain-containing protein n=1 Tax=Niallia sp. Krafla_26 TaxID=3064703 RepID=UPI003D16A488
MSPLAQSHGEVKDCRGGGRTPFFDLRTPLSSIKGYVEGLLDGVARDQEMRERYLRVIHDKSNHLDYLISNTRKWKYTNFPFIKKL